MPCVGGCTAFAGREASENPFHPGPGRLTDCNAILYHSVQRGRAAAMSATDPHDDLRWGALWRAGVLQRFLVLAFGIWLHAANSTLTATLIPSAIMEIGGVAFLSWTAVLYQVGSIVAAASIGLLSVRFGVRPGMVAAACLYLAGCMIAAAAPEMAVLLAGRLLQGAGGGALVALTHVAVAQMLPAHMMPRIMAILSAMWGASAFCGPAVGGLFAELFSWRAGFWAFAAQAAIYILALLVTVRDRSADPVGDHASLPKVRLAILAAAILSVATGGVLGFSPLAFVFALAGVFLLVMFFRRDRVSGATRLYPASAYRSGTPTRTGLFMVTLLFFSTVAFTVFGPMLVRLIYGLGPLAGGFLVALESVSWSVTAVLFSGLRPVHHGRAIRIAAILLIVYITGMAAMMGAAAPVWALFPFLIAGGAGFGLCYGFVTQRIVHGADAADRARASSAIPTSQMISYALGSASCGFVANGLGLSETSPPDQAAGIAFWLLIAFLPVAFGGAFYAWRLSRQAPSEQAPAG